MDISPTFSGWKMITLLLLLTSRPFRLASTSTWVPTGSSSSGGALPLLLLFSVAGRSYGDVLTGDAVAIEILRSAVGGTALALSVPLTTGIAAILARTKAT